MKKAAPLIIAVLAGITLVSCWQLGVAIKQRLDAETVAQEFRDQLVEIQQQRGELVLQLNESRAKEEDLTVQIQDMRKQVDAKDRFIRELEERMRQADAALEDMTAKLRVSRAENEILSRHSADLKEQMELAVREKEILAFKLGSMPELKKAIKELKQKMRLERIFNRKNKEWKVVPANPPVQPNIVVRPYPDPDPDIETAGNKGYIIRNGKGTYSQHVTVEVQPLGN
jgi:septal ring factor EnvC (AmiA/AmiB activator)